MAAGQRAPVPIPLSSLPALSKQASDERLINCYAEKVGSGDNERAAIYGAAGLTPLVMTLSTIGRGMFMLNGLLHSVHGNTLYRVPSSGAAVALGGLVGATSTTLIRAVNNGNASPQAWIVSQPNNYVLQGSSITLVTDPDLPAGVVDTDYLDGRIYLALADGRVFFTAINDVTIGALDFISAEANPDGLVGIRKVNQELWLLGAQTIEIWGSSGDANAPIARLPGAVIQSGCASRDSICLSRNRLYWLDTDGNYMRGGQGYQPEQVSNRGVYDAVRAVTDRTTISAYSYKLGEHSYVVLQCPSFCWVFDENSGLWHQRQSKGLTTWQANQLQYAYGKNVVSSSITGTLYYIDENSFSEGSDEILAVMRFPRMDSFPYGAVYHLLEFDMNTGVGIDTGGAGSDTINPKCTLRWSDDGGQTYKGGRVRILGLKGDYSRRIRFTRLGSSGDRGRIFQLEISSKVFKAVMNCNAIVGQLDFG